MKEHSGGLGNFLNEVTQTAEKNDSAQNSEQIIYIDIDDLESNPKNFYGLRDVNALAGLIAVSHLVEPLTVSKQDDGKYRIISGHRRRAAVQKLLDEGIYSERKLPCIVKTLKKITIEQEDGATIEFDEDAVEMLNLIASNRGQREERTIDEKLQEVKYLEMFAKAIYHQKNKGKRGRFRNFFAEEILNISKSQLQRISAMENLTDTVKAAIDDKRISETAAMAMTSMTPEEQNSCVEKILSGEIKGTVQEIQNLKSSKDKVDESPVENLDEVTEPSADESIIKDMASEPESVSEESSVKIEQSKEMEMVQGSTANLLPEKEMVTSDKKFVGKIIDVPEQFDDPQKEAKDWFHCEKLSLEEQLKERLYQERLAYYETLYSEAKRMNEEETNELKAAQWGIRASVARYEIEELKLQHSGQM